MKQFTPQLRDLVLVGGGHTHVQVIRSFGMSPQIGVRLTVIAREVETPYSGMLPGYVSGFYTAEQLHVDLGPLCRFANARLIVDEVVSIDPDNKRLSLDKGADLGYDIVSINSGGTPGTPDEDLIAVKPIGRFVPAWERILAKLKSGDKIGLVGGGAGAVELALAIAAVVPAGVELLIVTKGQVIVSEHNSQTRKWLVQQLALQKITVHYGFEATAYRQGLLVASDDHKLTVDYAFWVTGVEAAGWLANSSLTTNVDGFVEVNDYLQSTSHDTVFVAGDVAHMTGSSRPKSGVFAVRQGPVLTTNLRKAILNQSLTKYRPQNQFLSLIGNGRGEAVASRGVFFAAGKWVWRWKDWIDKRFMQRFQELPAMSVEPVELEGSFGEDLPDPMRCGGCGAKLAADLLHRVLARLPATNPTAVIRGIGDDAAIVRWGGGQLVLTADAFRAMVDDPYLFGRIAAHHSLNDIFAMGAKPIAALALATVQVMSDKMMEDDLFRMLSGAVDVFNDHDVALVGGHSGEALELSLGFSICGQASERTLEKSGIQIGDRLVLTKPLGTGVILAAMMRGKIKSRHWLAALELMDQSNAGGCDILVAHQARAMTDVTGFGLVGHLGEMVRASQARASQLGVTLYSSAVPVLDGVIAAIEAGYVSSLQANNEQALQDFEVSGGSSQLAQVRALVDPQTAGGLLAAVPAEQIPKCLAGLTAAGYVAAEIGEVTDGGNRIQIS